MKKISAILLLTVAFQVAVFAQDDAQFTMFPWATSYYNAGGIGEQSNTLCFTALFNNKYSGWNDVYTVNGVDSLDQTAPQDFMFNIESYLKKLHGSLGLSLIRDRVGYYKNVGVKLGYAYKLRIGGGHMGIGAQVSFYNQAIDANGLRPTQSGDQVLDQLSESTLDMDVNLGVYYKCDQWDAGIGVTQLLSGFLNDGQLRLSGENGSDRTPQLYVHGGYDWIVPSNPNWEILPQAMVKTDLTAKGTQFDIMVLGRYNGVMWGGVGYRLNDAVNLLFGTRPFYNSSNIYLKGLEAGISYGITANKFSYRRNRSFGDVEVMVRYCFDIYKPEIFSGYGSTRSIYKNQY